MDNEPYRDLTHNEACDLLAGFLRQQQIHVFREQPLPSGKIADILYFDRSMDISIVEVKTVLKASLVDQAWDKYKPWCHRLYVAVPNLTRSEVDCAPWIVQWRNTRSRLGVIGVYRDRVHIIRSAHRFAMPGKTYEKIYRLTGGI